MATGTIQEWFLDVNGKKTGPFTLEQIEGLLREGELLPQQKITSDYLQGRWLTVRELIDHLNESTGFQPPPRPADVTPTVPAVKGSGPDPAFSLLSALQSARERKDKSDRAAAVAAAANSQSLTSRKLGASTWMVVLGVVLVGVAVWALVLMVGQKADVASTTPGTPGNPTIMDVPKGSAPTPASAPDVSKPAPPVLPTTAKAARGSRGALSTTTQPPMPPILGDRDEREREREERDRERDRDRDRDRDSEERENLPPHLAPAPPPAAPPPQDPGAPDGNANPPPNAAPE